MKREILFDLSNVNKNDLVFPGVYKIVNTINNHFYIGSTDRSFEERFKEHCRYYQMYKDGFRNNMHPILWNAYDKYKISNFKVELLEIIQNKTSEYILEREEYYIHTLNPQYNIALFPTCGGKPNLGRKLSEDWKLHIKEKSKTYRHSQETLKRVTKNNKENGCKLIFKKDNNKLNFNSWVDAGKYFNLKSSTSLLNSYRKKGTWRGWKIIKISSQKKKIKVFVDNSEIIFNSFSECDKYFNMWRGYTSELTLKKSEQLIVNKYKFEII